MSESPTFLTTGDDATPRARDFASSEMFERLFREGMDLVEETASYLDGPGRDDAKALDRAGALSYATESMKLTTRLMQAASWLLAQRAVAEGEMTLSEATDGKYRLSLDRPTDGLWPDGEPAPQVLLDLVARSRALFERLQRLDDSLYIQDDVPAEANPVAGQMDLLRGAFGE